MKKAFEGRLLNKAEIEQCKTAADYDPASELLTRIERSQNERSRNEKIQADASARSAKGKLAKEQALRLAQGKKKSTTKQKSNK